MQKSRSRSKSKKSGLQRLQVKLRAIIKKQAIGLQQYVRQVKQLIQSFLEQLSNQQEEQFGRCMVMLVNGFTSKLNDVPRYSQKDRLSRQIEVYVHWNENMIEEIQKHSPDTLDIKLRQAHELLKEQQNILAGRQSRDLRLQELIGKIPDEKEAKPNLKLNLQGLKRAEFHEQFYRDIDKFSHSWREQALKQKKY